MVSFAQIVRALTLLLFAWALVWFLAYLRDGNAVAHQNARQLTLLLLYTAPVWLVTELGAAVARARATRRRR